MLGLSMGTEFDILLNSSGDMFIVFLFQGIITNAENVYDACFKKAGNFVPVLTRRLKIWNLKHTLDCIEGIHDFIIILIKV